MSDCETVEQLKNVSSTLRKKLEESGSWNKYKADIVILNRSHKERIESEETEIEVEFEEVEEDDKV